MIRLVAFLLLTGGGAKIAKKETPTHKEWGVHFILVFVIELLQFEWLQLVPGSSGIEATA